MHHDNIVLYLRYLTPKEIMQVQVIEEIRLQQSESCSWEFYLVTLFI